MLGIPNDRHFAAPIQQIVVLALPGPTPRHGSIPPSLFFGYVVPTTALERSAITVYLDVLTPINCATALPSPNVIFRKSVAVELEL